VRTPSEELVNSASPKLALRFKRSRVNQPDPTFPQSPGIIYEATNFDFHRRCPLRSFNELKRLYQRIYFCIQIDMHRLFTGKTAAGFSHATIFANEFKPLAILQARVIHSTNSS